MRKGYIVKGVAGFYTVVNEDGETITCRARGQLRNEHIKPVVGDLVLYDTFETGDATIEQILPRSNYIRRPVCANISQGLLAVAVKKPDISYLLLDKMLIDNKASHVKSVIVLTKCDLADEGQLKYITDNYCACCESIIFTSATTKEGINELKEILRGNISAFRGVSGAGKSFLMKLICPDCDAQVGELSKKISRGKNTTRYTQLVECDKNSFILDTPGFSDFAISGIPCEELWKYYPEFYDYSDCRYQNCLHISEPGCRLKEAVSKGLISRLRYDNYLAIYEQTAKKYVSEKK